MNDNFSFTDLRRHWNEATAKEPEYCSPEEIGILDVMVTIFHEMKKRGWREIVYCPKDGSSFLAVEAGSPSAVVCTYSGEWPRGGWWAHCHGDMWPARPILWKPLPPKVAA